METRDGPIQGPERPQENDGGGIRKRAAFATTRCWGDHVSQAAHDLWQFAMMVAGTPMTILERLNRNWAGMVILGGTFLAGGGTVVFFGNLRSHEPRLVEVERVIGVSQEMDIRERLVQLEGRYLDHIENVTAPRVQQLDDLEGRVTANEAALGTISLTLACMYYGINSGPCSNPIPPPGL